MKILVTVLCVVTVVSCTPITKDSAAEFIDEANSCVDKEDAVTCLKEHALDTVQRLEGARSLKLFSGVTLLNSSPRKSRSMEPLSIDADVRQQQVTERLWKSTAGLMDSGEIELTFGNDDEEKESRALDNDDEGRAKNKKKKIKKKQLKMLIPLLLLGKAKAVALVVLALLIIAASLFKLTFMAKIAFIIKIIAIIKALLAQKHKEVTYEVAHGWEPHAEHHVEHDHGWEGNQGWSRSQKEGSLLAYSAYDN